MTAPVPSWPRYSSLVLIGRIAGGGAVLVVLGIFAFILRTEWAHDPERCPYREGELRQVADGVAVQEELRRCLDDVEERRWIILRDGEQPREFARRRMNRKYFAQDGYRWSVATDAQGDLVLEVHNGGAPPIEVQEDQLLEQ